MISLKNIWTISQYEGKVLWRNWFFRILAIAGIFFETFFNVAVFTEADNPRWYALSNNSVMPYACMLLISIPQAAAVIFLATGLVKKDKKLDTNEVFFVRAMSNLDYVLGKALALFKLFFLLDLVFLVISMIFNLTGTYTTFNPAPYVLYPLVTSMPTIIFTTGISFLLVTLIKNQPVTIILLLGIAGVELIYYFDQFSNILDFSAFRLPMLTSEISGFADFEFAILQRSFYIITGMACLLLTAFFLDRLSGQRVAHVATLCLGILLLVLSSVVMLRLWDRRQDPMDLRKAMITVNDQWADAPNITILKNSIELEFLNTEMRATSQMLVKNNTASPLHTIYFTLNPSLTVEEVLSQNKPLEPVRNLHLISIDLGTNLSPGEEMPISIRYRGSIDESVAYLEVDRERYEAANDYFMFSLQKKYAFFQPNYVLLTKDVLWYPESRVGYSRAHTTHVQPSFIYFDLKVTIPDGLVAISQGDLVVEDNTYHFTPAYDLPQLSLTIGNYVKKELRVDEVTYSVYHYPDHDFFAKHLNQLSDTLGFLITDLVNEYQDAQKIRYPFRKMQFVEVPIQFAAYAKIYESHQAFVQPETVYYPEQGGSIEQFDFRRQMEDMNRQSADRNQSLSDKQKQANLFNDLIKRVFTHQISDAYVFDGYNVDKPDYSIFPNYYTYNSGIVSQEWALLNRSIATYLQNDKPAQIDYSRNRDGVSFTEACNELMRNASFTEILTEEDFNKIQKSVSLKGEYLFSYLSQLTGEENFKTFLYDWVNTHRHQRTSYEQFRKAMNARFRLDIDPIIKKVYSDKSQPAFEILEVQKYEVLDGDRKRYQILVDLKNSGENDGVLEVKFNAKDESEGDYYNQRINEESADELAGRLTVLKKGERKLLGFILDEKPDNITFNTFISRNIPSVITVPVGPVTQRKGTNLFEGERILSDEKDANPYERIVDNEDAGFTSFSPIKPTYLKAFLDNRKKSEQRYYGSWDRSYSKWLATTGSDFYGRVIRSAHFTRSGSGEKEVTWKSDLQEGYYDIYVYMMGKNQNEYIGDGDNRQFYYHYIVEHADGADEIDFNISTAEPGWNFLGSYFFDKNGGKVRLTDECELRTVYADAVKWVKQ